MQVINDFEDYEILDLGNGRKIEKWGNIILNRPDPQVIWSKEFSDELLNNVNATYLRSDTGGGKWNIKNIPDTWDISYQDLKFNLKLMGFKHTGLFPEQAYNWTYIRNLIKESDKKNIKVLNLFAYTGALSVACLKENASVVHVDSSRGMIEWAKENVKLNNLEDKSIRFLVDDVIKFVKKEINRGNKYDIIVMDPPSFGRGNKNEIWSIEKDLYNLVKLCQELLSEKPLLFLINSYTTGLSMTVLENILNVVLNEKYEGTTISDELGLKVKNSNLILPCGIFARYEFKN